MMAAPVAGRLLWTGWKYRKKLKKLKKPAKKVWKKGKKGAKWTYKKAKRGTQWAGTRLVGEWQKRQPDPMRPWTYRRMLGVPESLEFIQRGPRGYYDYKMQQYETAKRLWDIYQSREGGSSKSSPSSRISRGTNRTASGGRTPHYPPRPPRGGMGGARRRRKTVPYRKGGCPPGYRYDRRRKMCVRK